MKISDLELCLVEVPRVPPLAPLRSLLVRLTTESGLEGWGEAEPLWPPEQLPARQQHLLSCLVGRNVFEIEDLLLLDALKPDSLRAAVETACWDLAARVARQPLCHLLGGGFRKRVPVRARLAPDPLEIVPYWSRELAAQGYYAQTVVSTGSVDDDLAMLLAVREMAGSRCQLALDAASRYDLTSAADLMSRLSASLVAYIVDPLRDGEPFRLAHLQREAPVRVVVSAALRAPSHVLAMASASGAGGVILSPARLGGLLRTYQSGVVASAAGMRASLATRDCLGIAMAAMLQLAACLPGFTSAHECTYHQLLDDILVEPLDVVEGMVVVPTGPGLGIEVDRAKLEQYQLG